LSAIEVGEEDAAQMIARLDTELKSALEVWRKAWAKKDFATYFAAYSPLFKPGKAFADIEAWKASRRDLIGNKQHIQVDIQDLKITHLEGNHARLEFTQRYQADGFSRSDFKLMLMEYTESRWRIIREMTAVQK